MADYRAVDAEQLEADLTIVADAIREKSGTSEPLTFPNGMADAVRGIQSGGGVNLLDYAQTAYCLFRKTKFDVKDVVLSFGNKAKTSDSNNALSQIFEYTTGLETVRVESDIIFTNGVNASSMFRAEYNKGTIKKIELPCISNKDTITSTTNMFFNQNSLKEVDCLFDFNNVTNCGSMFNYCTSLERVSFKEETIKFNISFSHSALLSAESIQSIIDGLADLNGKTSQTLTLYTDVVTKLTQEQLDTISAKNWVVG